LLFLEITCKSLCELQSAFNVTLCDIQYSNNGTLITTTLCPKKETNMVFVISSTKLRHLWWY